MSEIYKGVLFNSRKYQLKMKKTFYSKKVGKTEVNKFQIGELVWLKVQSWILDMKKNKGKWVGPCKIVSMSRRGSV